MWSWLFICWSFYYSSSSTLMISWKNGTKVLPLFPSHWLHRLWWWILYWPRFLKRKVRGIRREKVGSCVQLCQLKTGFLWLSFWHFYVNIVSWSPDLIVKRALSQYPQCLGVLDRFCFVPHDCPMKHIQSCSSSFDGGKWQTCLKLVDCRCHWEERLEKVVPFQTEVISACQCGVLEKL